VLDCPSLKDTTGRRDVETHHPQDIPTCLRAFTTQDLLRMASPQDPTMVDHPLWSGFLRWCTIRPKDHRQLDGSVLAIPSRHTGAPLESLEDFQYSSLPQTEPFIRLATLLPGEFNDDIAVKINQHVLQTPPRSKNGSKNSRETLKEIRKHLPRGWEAFQTVSKSLTLMAEE
jgi:hypothetical protein